MGASAHAIHGRSRPCYGVEADMTNASLQPKVSLWQLLFRPSRRQEAPPESLWPRAGLALGGPLALAGLACLVVAAAAWVVLGGMMAEVAVTEVTEGVFVTERPVADAFWNHKLFGHIRSEERPDGFSVHTLFDLVPFTYQIVALCVAQIVGGLALLGSSALAWRRRGGALKLLRKFYVVGYIVPFLGIYVVGEAMNVLIQGPGRTDTPVILGGDHFLSAYWVVPIKLALIFGLLAVETLLVAAHLLARSDEVATVYGSEKVARQKLGIIHAGTGKDRRVWTSRWQSLGVHAIAILVLPWLLIFGAWTSGPEAYKPPGGDGGGGPQEVVKAKVQQQKPKRKLHYVVRINSPIYLHGITMDESDVTANFDEHTTAQYVATGAGGIGKGGKGTGSGWGKGKADGEIRFIRLQHSGRDWDDGMTVEKGRGDQNLLEYFRSLTDFRIREPESISITTLKLYKKGQAPPFVFLTGHTLEGITTSDWRTLRMYCEDGGLIFVSCASPTFGQQFRRMMQEVFPGQPLSDIPNDDPIFREPYLFADGAPPLWHHDGKRALGVRAPGTSRLCVFYHPGDLHDAWKSGHSGLSQDKANSAMKLSINVISYAISNYLDMHFPD